MNRLGNRLGGRRKALKPTLNTSCMTKNWSWKWQVGYGMAYVQAKGIPMVEGGQTTMAAAWAELPTPVVGCCVGQQIRAGPICSRVNLYVSRMYVDVQVILGIEWLREHHIRCNFSTREIRIGLDTDGEVLGEGSSSPIFTESVMGEYVPEGYYAPDAQDIVLEREGWNHVGVVERSRRRYHGRSILVVRVRYHRGDETCDVWEAEERVWREHTEYFP